VKPRDEEQKIPEYFTLYTGPVYVDNCGMVNISTPGPPLHVIIVGITSSIGLAGIDFYYTAIGDYFVGLCG
jgi:hypothetical protein